MKQISYNSISSLSFYSDNLNEMKYAVLYNKAIKIRDFKNELSLNIRNRVTLNVLRSKLLKENQNGELEPINNLSKEKIKEILTNCSYNCKSSLKKEDINSNKKLFLQL